MFKIAKAVEKETELYDLKDWNYEFMRCSKTEPPQGSSSSQASKASKDAQYVVTLSVFMHKRGPWNPEVEFAPEKVEYKMHEETYHQWYDRLVYEADMVVAYVDPLDMWLQRAQDGNRRRRRKAFDEEDDGKEQPHLQVDSERVHIYFVEPAQFRALGVLLDHASAIFCYDALETFSCLQRIQSDEDLLLDTRADVGPAFIGGAERCDSGSSSARQQQQQQRAPVTQKQRNGRYKLEYFVEQRIMHWRLKSNDIKTVCHRSTDLASLIQDDVAGAADPEWTLFTEDEWEAKRDVILPIQVAPSQTTDSKSSDHTDERKKCATDMVAATRYACYETYIKRRAWASNF